MNIWYLLAGLGTLVLMMLHAIAGGQTILKPMREAHFEPVARATMTVCWHAITAILALGGVGLVAGAFNPEAPWAAPVVLLITGINASFAAVFLSIGLTTQIPGAIWKLGQWMAFVPLVVFGLVGIA